jgi:hypothetical protein
MRVVDGRAAGVGGSLLAEQNPLEELGSPGEGTAMNGPRRVARERHYTQLGPSRPVPQRLCCLNRGFA